jgi:hypothetical protein
MFQTSGDVTRIFVRTHMRVDKGEGRKVGELEPQILGLLTISSGLGLVMVWLGMRVNALEERRRNRCPACGVVHRRGSCSYGNRR